jgi:ribonuclease P protein component
VSVRLQRFSQRITSSFFDQATRQHNRYFRAFIVPAPKDLSLAVIVPKKTVRLATDRNALRRRFKAALTPLLSHLPAQQLVIVPFAASQELSVSALTEEISKLFKLPSDFAAHEKH